MFYHLAPNQIEKIEREVWKAEKGFFYVSVQYTQLCLLKKNKYLNDAK